MSDMIDQMEQAMQDDDDAVRSGKPALKKLSILPDLTRFLQRRYIIVHYEF